ncbi:MAG TPA: phosphoglycerate mutase family protein [Thermoanaerobaculia bacterium]
MKKLSAVLLFAAVLLSGVAEAKTPGTVIVVRHAEAGTDDPKDPSLSEAGTARAAALQALAQNAGVKAVYVTQFRRTRDTAAPLAAALKIPVIVFDVDGASLASFGPALAKRIAEEHPNETVLVVGHSNTVPLIVKELAGIDVPKIEHSEYSRVYVIRDGHVIAAQYGAR